MGASLLRPQKRGQIHLSIMYQTGLYEIDGDCSIVHMSCTGPCAEDTDELFPDTLSDFAPWNTNRRREVRVDLYAADAAHFSEYILNSQPVNCIAFIWLVFAMEITDTE